MVEPPPALASSHQRCDFLGSFCFHRWYRVAVRVERDGDVGVADDQAARVSSTKVTARRVLAAAV